MGIEGDIDIEKAFRRGIKSARKRAGHVVGRGAVKERIEGIKHRNSSRIGGGVRRNSSGSLRRNQINKGGQISRRRKKAVRYVIGGDGTLVLLDHAPMARAQEFGETIRAKRGRLFIQDARRRKQAGEDIFITKTGAVMAVKKHQKGSKKKPTPRLIGTLRPKVRIKRLPRKARLTHIAEKWMDQYAEEIETQINKQSF